ncbi:alpha/beta hydrolase [Streptomyces sp. NPDC058268]|uniref:alpha/beta hydrolase n=1 Tax=Streptomyces sp. NPDC058268 TaxID=3346413 RepID=UPI0036E5183B
MNDVAELKQYVEVHARGQRIQGFPDVLGRIESDEGDGPGTWVAEWSRAAERLAEQGKALEASRHFALARFPFVDGPGRGHAQERCAQTLEQWQREQAPELERLDLELPGGRVRCWTTGLSATERRPLLLIMGGIVTVKEQWVPALVRMRRLGMAAVVTEMPGVGENTLPYDAKSWRMLSGILDAVGDRSDTDRTYAMALSFSGHMALRCALEDRRIRGVITVGAPVHDFFTDRLWQADVPHITTATLAHLTGGTAPQVLSDMADFALSDDQLASLDAPVHYVASRQDEIIPVGETHRLERHVRRLRLLEHDDVHGAPRHTAETQLWCVRSLLRMDQPRSPRTAALDLMWRAARTRRRLARR